MRLPPMFFNDIDVAANVRTLASVQFAFHTIRIHGHTIDGFFDVFGYEAREPDILFGKA
jgi:hypothetical protein